MNAPFRKLPVGEQNQLDHEGVDEGAVVTSFHIVPMVVQDGLYWEMTEN